MEAGVAVWLKDTTGGEAWVTASVVSNVEKDGKFCVTVRADESGEESSFSVGDENEDIAEVKLQNSIMESEAENLINLPHLHEPAILHCLELRYARSEIYTYTGPILIAMNPFKRVPALYTTQMLEQYYNRGLFESQGIDSATSTPLAPHVYAIADAAYRNMMNVVNQSRHAKTAPNADQAILISGESGAGKTESTKIVLRYLTTVGNAKGGTSVDEGSVMDKVLMSNPILEAFGNSKTIRNDNSSRFGKFIELHFNRKGHLIGGQIETYLLEKVRIPSQQAGERGFHIFYQMCEGASEEERAKWRLMPIEDVRYANRGKVFKLPHLNDTDEFNDMRRALKTLDFPEEDRVSLLNCIAAIMHIGQLEFVPDMSGAEEGSAMAGGAEVQAALAAAVELFGVQAPDLISAFTMRTITTRYETYTKKLTAKQASDGRDAMAKAIYGKVFDWLVATINKSIAVENAADRRAEVGVLDIFGFECFQHNSFEQLCINYTNETLQQQFNGFVFKLEQNEYEKEKISWSFISFPDNQDCLDLIEDKRVGLLSQLDDECKGVSGNDGKYADNLYRNLSTHEKFKHRFSATKAQVSQKKFCINHYAGPVVYATATFVEKNKDELPKETASLFEGSSVGLLNRLFAAAPAPEVTTPVGSPMGKSSASTTPTVGTQFRTQLHQLMRKIETTQPHYIRCLKPNDQNKPETFHRMRITEQLRYGGVLEAVRVARSGFPVRMIHADFYARYRPLANPFSPLTASLPRVLGESGDAKVMSDQLLEALWDETVPEESAEEATPKKRPQRRASRVSEMELWKGKGTTARESVQLGLTKVFLRKQAHDLLEARRSRRLVSAARKIQCYYRRHIIRKMYFNIRNAILSLQRFVRGLMARRRAHHLRCVKAAVIVQKYYRMFKEYARFSDFSWALQRLQSLFRGRQARGRFRVLQQVHWSVRLQRLARGMVRRRLFLRTKRRVVRLQCLQRSRVAVRTLRRIKAEAKDLGKLQQNNELMKQEIEELRRRAGEEAERIAREMKEKLQEEQKEALVEVNRELESEREVSGSLRGLLKEAEGRIAQLEAEVKELRANGGATNAAPPPPPPRTTSFSSPTQMSPEKLEQLKRVSGDYDALRALYEEESQMLLQKTSESQELSEKLLAMTQDKLEMESANGVLNEEIARLRSLLFNQGSLGAGAAPAPAEAGAGSSARRKSLASSVRSSMSLGGKAVMSAASKTADMAANKTADLVSKTVDLAKSSSSARRGSVKRDEPMSPASSAASMLFKSMDTSEIARLEENFGDDDDEDDDDEEEDDFPAPGGAARRGSVRRRSSAGEGMVQHQRRPSTESEVVAIGTFNKNVEAYKTKLRQGFHVTFYDGFKGQAGASRLTKFDGILRMQVDGQLSITKQQASFKSLLGIGGTTKSDAAPVRISDIAEVLPVTPEMVKQYMLDRAEEALMVFMASSTSGPTGDGSDSNVRVTIMRAGSLTEKQLLYNTLRTVMVSGIAGGAEEAAPAPTASKPTRRLSAREAVLLMKADSVKAAADAAIAAAEAENRGGGATSPSSHQPHHHHRRGSAASSQATMDAAKAAAAAATTTSQDSMKQRRASIKATADQDLAKVQELQNQLMVEQANHHKLVVHVMTMSNELNEKDQLVIAAKKREEALAQLLKSKEKIFEQDASARVQLGQKMQALFIEKEDALEQVEYWRDMYENLKGSVEGAQPEEGKA